jgi:hypothetical protein
VTYASGMSLSNRMSLDGWNLVGTRQFQFGDLRIESPSTVIVVEAESAGGVTNLAKYWPYLAARPRKRLVLAYLFQVGSSNDYVSHLQLWAYLVERMRADLNDRAGVRWEEDWEARRIRHGRMQDATGDVAAYMRGAAT